jgi:hypothetical protein
MCARKSIRPWDWDSPPPVVGDDPPPAADAIGPLPLLPPLQPQLLPPLQPQPQSPLPHWHSYVVVFVQPSKPGTSTSGFSSVPHGQSLSGIQVQTGLQVGQQQGSDLPVVGGLVRSMGKQF